MKRTSRGDWTFAVIMTLLVIITFVLMSLDPGCQQRSLHSPGRLGQTAGAAADYSALAKRAHPDTLGCRNNVRFPT